MKKLLAITLFSMLALLATSQASYNDSREDFLRSLQQNKKFRARIKANNFILMQVFRYKGNNPAGFLTNEWRFDKRGNSTDYFFYKHGKINMHNAFTYDDSDRTTSYTFYKGSGKLKGMEKITYDNAGNIIEEDNYKKDTQTINKKFVKTYDSRNNITESKEFDRKGKLNTRVSYTYYDDGSKKQTIQYSGKGKVKQLWNFDCNPVGKSQAEKFKDTNKVCVHYETDKDGNPIKVKEEYDGGTGLFGKTYRNVTKYNKNNNLLDLAWYNLNGKLISHWSATYNSDGKALEYVTYKDGTQEILYRTTYTYGSDGNTTENVIYKKSHVVAKDKYVYASSVSAPAK